MFWEKIKYFKKDEWVKDPDKVNPRLILCLDRIRKTSQIPISIHVAWDDGGHSPNSYHYKGLAVDFHFIDPAKDYLKQFLILSSFREIGAIGFYPEWNNVGWHIDLRERNPKLVWVREKGRYIYGYDKLAKVLRRKKK